MFRRVSNEKSPTTWPQLVSDMTRGWLRMERTAPSTSPVRSLVKEIQSSVTAGHRRPPQKVPRNTIMPSRSLLQTQRQRSARTSLSHPHNPGSQSSAKLAQWRRPWEPGGSKTARRVSVTRLRPAPPQTRLEMTKQLQPEPGLFSAALPLSGKIRTPMRDPDLLLQEGLQSSGTEGAVCQSMKGGPLASRANPQITMWGPPRCDCLRCKLPGRYLLWRRALRQPPWGWLIGLTGIVWIMLCWPERNSGRDSTGTWATAGFWRTWGRIVPRSTPWGPHTACLAPSDPRMWGTGTVGEAAEHVDDVAGVILMLDEKAYSFCCLKAIRGQWQHTTRQNIEIGCAYFLSFATKIQHFNCTLASSVSIRAP